MSVPEGQRGAASVLALGIVGAVIKDPIADQVAWSEYLEVVARERAGWSEFYTACRDVS